MENVYGRINGKKRLKSGNKEGGSGKLRDLYVPLFKYCHFLPDEVGRQRPKVLFELLDGLDEDNETKRNEDIKKAAASNAYLAAFYGL